MGLVVGSTAAARAQTTPVTTVSLPNASAAQAVGTITVDGKLDEAAWSRATPITDFHQQQPNEGVSPTQGTEVRVLYDARAIYIGARMYEPLGAAGSAPRSRAAISCWTRMATTARSTR